VLIMGAISRGVNWRGNVFVVVNVAIAVLLVRVHFVCAKSVAYHIVNTIFLNTEDFNISSDMFNLEIR